MKIFNRYVFSKKIPFIISCWLLMISVTSCGVYSFRDVSIDYTKIKTVKIFYIDNKSPGYKNPQVSQLLTDKIQQKITSQTKLSRTNNDDADMQISGYISDYSVTTSAISSTQASSNRLTVGVHLSVRTKPDAEAKTYDVSRSFDFSANLSLQEAEGQLLSQIVSNLTDDIFNRIFSNW